jgi:hypothetical protein
MLVAAMVATVFAAPAFSRKKASTPAKNGEQTVVHLQKVGDTPRCGTASPNLSAFWVARQ